MGRRVQGAPRRARTGHDRETCARPTAAHTRDWRARARRRRRRSGRRPAAAARCPGPTYRRPCAVAQRKRTAPAADARIDDGEVHALRHVRERVRERKRALQDPAGPHAVREVDDLDAGRDALHHAVAGADEVVLQSEVAEERDHGRERTTSSRPSTSCDSATPTTSRPRPSATAAVCGPIATTGMRASVAANARAAERRGEENEVAFGRRLGAKLDRAVERDEDRRRARPRAGAARPRPRRAARGPAEAPRAAPPASRPPGRDRPGGRAQRRASAVAGPIAARCAGGAASRRASSAAPFGLVTTTQSYGRGVDAARRRAARRGSAGSGRPRGRAPRAARRAAPPARRRG